MNILILAGGVFPGAAVLDAALARGHAVSVFNRGRSRAVWPAPVEVLRGDRQTDLAALAGRRWDAVVDTCGHTPADTRAVAQGLRGSDQYLFVSSISAYASFDTPGLDESAPLASFDGVAPDDRDMAHYGAQKAACEAAVREAWGEQALIVRPGLIVGPGDPTGRFNHWPWRAAAPRPMLVPHAPAQRLQFIDVRAMAAWMVALLEARAVGAFNATGPVGGDCTWRDLANGCVAAAARCGYTPASQRPAGPGAGSATAGEFADFGLIRADRGQFCAHGAHCPSIPASSHGIGSKLSVANALQQYCSRDQRPLSLPHRHERLPPRASRNQPRATARGRARVGAAAAGLGALYVLCALAPLR